MELRRIETKSSCDSTAHAKLLQISLWNEKDCKLSPESDQLRMPAS